MVKHEKSKKSKKTKESKKVKKTQKEKGPKRPLSAFFFFANERRKSLKLQQPDLKVTEISKVIGVEWNKLPESEKEPFVKLALDDRSRYENEKIAILKEKKKPLDDESDVEEIEIESD
jgi:hypothetical protein